MCNAEFEADDLRRKFCSDLCAAKSLRDRQVEYTKNRQKKLYAILKASQ